MYTTAHTDIYKLTRPCYSAIKKEWNLVKCDNTDGRQGHYAKWNKLDRERQIPYYVSCMINILLKTKKLNNNNKKKQAHRYKLMNAKDKVWRVGEMSEFFFGFGFASA